MAGSGHVKHHGRGELVIGDATESADVKHWFPEAEVPVEVSKNVMGPLWAKLIINCAYNALSAIAIEAKENLEVATYTALVDKGYHNGREIEACQQANITTIVAHQEQGKSNENGTQPDYLVSKFNYDSSTDSYTCPQGETLHTTGKWHKKTRDKDSYEFKKYRTPKCKTCPVKHLCTSRTGGREIDRSQYADAVEANNKRYQENPQLYRKRQEINEHIFGTIKRQWGYNHTNLIGLEKVNGEHSLIMLVYNIKRSINILGVPGLLGKLKKWNIPYKANVIFVSKMTYLKPQSALFIFQYKQVA
jgi:hypothetical protein